MPEPKHVPSYRPPSTRDAPRFRRRGQRERSAGAFTADADAYDDIRPGYPQAVAELIDGASRVLDVGAGTGKFTGSLLDSGPPAREVFACDPSPEMVRVLRSRLDVPVWRATAEATGAAGGSFDAVCLAQTWHWVDATAACREVDRVLSPDGQLLLVWNSLDVTDPWVLRLARIMHSGDIMREGFTPPLAEPFEVSERLSTRWEQELDTDGVLDLTATRSYWLRNGEAVRDRVRGNLDWYLFEHTGLTPGDPVTLPYRTEAFLIARV